MTMSAFADRPQVDGWPKDDLPADVTGLISIPAIVNAG
jgi:hypothetical protein